MANERRRKLRLQWESKLRYHENNLVLLMGELDGLDVRCTYTSMLVEFWDEMAREGDQSSASSRRRSTGSLLRGVNINIMRSKMHRIDYEAQFYAELRAWHNAKYASILIDQVLHCTDSKALEALLDDLNSIDLPPPEAPACQTG
ncbi:hypothetical protein BOTBODRAFT_25970 [Botryobasidium botryosum FD-172 SS1]|uniref:Uncharacterized protein n=1 Tax=Botryobasidium botryosum (strain FD-172 SS1) TaxID=930990 RepID=A0A067NBM2_BOTB1|nr:hypothetical protein BOTBODRAFT_25970 [Botryobasidium botryosum FD-172 SS1]